MPIDDLENHLVESIAAIDWLLMRQLVALQEKFKTSRNILPLLDSTPLDPDLSPGNKPGLNPQSHDSIQLALRFDSPKSLEIARNSVEND